MGEPEVTKATAVSETRHAESRSSKAVGETSHVNNMQVVLEGARGQFV